MQLRELQGKWCLTIFPMLKKYCGVLWSGILHNTDYLFSSCHLFISGVRLGRRLQAADGPGAGSEDLPRLPRKRWLPGHHGDLLPPSTTRPPAQPDTALHRLSWQSGLPRPRPSRGDSQPDRQLHRPERAEHRVPVRAGWCCKDDSAWGLRRTPVLSRNFSEGKTAEWAQTLTHSNGLIVIR